MSIDRNPGSILLSASIEPTISGSLDARDTVKTYASLILAETWKAPDGEAYVFKGMTTVVTDDPDPTKNGSYRLSALPYTDFNNWVYTEGGSASGPSYEPFTIYETPVVGEKATTVSLTGTEITVKATSVIDNTGALIELVDGSVTVTEESLKVSDMIVVYSDDTGYEAYPVTTSAEVIEVEYIPPHIISNGNMYTDEIAISSTANNEDVARLLDDSESNWAVRSTELPANVDIAFNDNVKLQGIDFKFTGDAIAEFALQGTTDEGVNWVDIQVFTLPNGAIYPATPISTQTAMVDVANQGYYNGYRLVITKLHDWASDGGDTRGQIIDANLICKKALADEGTSILVINTATNPISYYDKDQAGTLTLREDLTTPPLAYIVASMDGSNKIINYEPGTHAYKFTDSEKWFIENLVGGGTAELPIASDTVLGGIKVGSGLSIDGEGVLSSTGGGGDILYTSPEPTTEEVGGVKVGTTFTDTPITEVLDNIFNPEKEPVLVDPSAIFTKNIGDFVEVGAVFDITLSADFDKGSITPAYTTSGERSGDIISLVYTGTSLPTDPVVIASPDELPNVQSLTGLTATSAGTITWTVAANYAEGEQPLTNKGNEFDSPLPAGVTEVASIAVTATYPVFATTEDITEQTKQPLGTIGAFIEVDFIGENDNGDKQTIAYTNSLKATTGIEIYSTLSGKWEWLNGSKEASLSGFAVSTVDKDINGTTVAYRQYVNTSAKVGARSIRFYL